jgi:hypothetical protein
VEKPRYEEDALWDKIQTSYKSSWRRGEPNDEWNFNIKINIESSKAEEKLKNLLVEKLNCAQRVNIDIRKLYSLIFLILIAKVSL